MRYVYRLSLYLTLFILLPMPFAFGDGVRCQKFSVEGLEANYTRAKSIIGNADTQNINQIRIYIEKFKQGIYVQTNFCSAECDHKNTYPVKIASTEMMDIRLVMKNIIFEEGITEPELDSLLSQSKIFLDTSLFNSDGIPVIDLNGAMNVDIVSGERGLTLASGDVMNVRNSKPLLVSKVLGCCVLGFPPLLTAKILESVVNAKFDKSNVHFASLVNDTATNALIKKSKFFKKLASSTTSIKSAESVMTQIKKAGGGTMVLLGHVEEGNFVARNGEHVLFKTDFETIHKEAKNNNVKLIHLGCLTSKEISENTVGVGVMSTFNTYSMAGRLENAIRNSDNFGDFLNLISSDDVKIVIDKAFTDKLKGDGIKASIWARSKGKFFWYKIAELLFLR